MKKIYAILILILLVTPSAALARDWYEAEESSSCDYSAPASKVMADTAEDAGSTAGVDSTLVRDMTVERDTSSGASIGEMASATSSREDGIAAVPQDGRTPSSL